MIPPIRIGTRESRLAVWQAGEVQQQLQAQGYHSELVYIKSEGDLDLTTPLYEMGVQGIFTRSLDIALLNHKIDVAVHSMKDVPTRLPQGIVQAAVLPRGPSADLLVLRNNDDFLNDDQYVARIGTSSIRRRAQWLHRYPHHDMQNLRGNMQTRLQKLHIENWDAAIFAQAGLERIGLRPEQAVALNWMLPAPAQGAIMVVARDQDHTILEACRTLNDRDTECCTSMERDFLRRLLGGCSTPISALAEIRNGSVYFRGSVFSPDGSRKVEVEQEALLAQSEKLGWQCAEQVLHNGGEEIVQIIRRQTKVQSLS